MKLFKLTEAAEILAKRGELAALQFASKLNCLGRFRDSIQRGWEAHNRPDFYRSIGKDPEELVAVGISDLRQLLNENSGEPEPPPAPLTRAPAGAPR